MPKVHFAGCCLIDYIFDSVSFLNGSFKPFLSVEDGDGGIVPGKLVFSDVFEQFAGFSADEAASRIRRVYGAPRMNLGGPAGVAAIHAAQMLSDLREGSDRWTVSFFGGRGNDEAGTALGRFFDNTPVDYHATILPGDTPVTWVFSDPSWDGEKGERAFLGKRGMSGNFVPAMLDDRFFNAAIHAYGGTALVPGLHRELSTLLTKGRERGSLQIVHTVYDFYNQQNDPVSRWPMGDGDEAYRHIDLLITDREEARRLSGKDTAEDALSFFLSMGTGAAVVTDGPHKVIFAAAGGRFKPVSPTSLPVSREVARIREVSPELLGDTTGCGDNFAGGIIADLAVQIDAGEAGLDLRTAVPHGIAAGGFACTCIGGPWFETRPGEKKELMKPFYN